MSEIPVHPRPGRLVDWINPTGIKKVHSLIDKVYQRKNLEMAWEKVKANRGSGGVDGQSLEGFAAQLDQQLDRLQSELKENVYRPQPVLTTGNALRLCLSGDKVTICFLFRASTNPEGGKARRVSYVGNPDDL